MAARTQFLRVSGILLAGTGTAAIALPPRRIYAEAPVTQDEDLKHVHQYSPTLIIVQLPLKKPIYGSPKSAPTEPKPPGITDPLTNNPPSVPKVSTPTPTDRLEKQIRKARLFLHDQATYVEDNFNAALTWTFKKETNFANTIASLAPSPETGEQLMPGLIYVLVATMAGSIISRNRNILIRATFPLAVGITAGWMLIPVTMRNTGDLLWEYEKNVPAVAETHSYIAGFARQAYKEISDRSRSGIQWADTKAADTRKKVEDIVKEGH